MIQYHVSIPLNFDNGINRQLLIMAIMDNLLFTAGMSKCIAMHVTFKMILSFSVAVFLGFLFHGGTCLRLTAPL